ncbi:MAG: ATP synthase F1 subunit delta [Oligoflexia bacterium]|nr:ATP synthase F1 subunit delta [Oligoflexia bacterium]
MSVSKSYAKVLYETVSENKSPQEIAKACDDLQAALSAFARMLDESRALRLALESPVTSVREKIAVLTEVCQRSKFPEVLDRFLVLLANKGRLSLFAEIVSLFRVVRLEAEGGIFGHLTSAEAMTEADVLSLSQAFSKKLGKRVSFEVKTDPSLLAGVKVTVGGVTYNGTLQSQLEKLRDQFVL